MTGALRRRACRLVIASAAALCAPVLGQQTDDHQAPPPPSQPMPAMSPQDMDRVMDMHDDPLLAMFKLDQFERAFGDGPDATEWEAEAWIGRDFDKLWLRSEGASEAGTTDARIEAFWDHAFASFWDWQLGVRHDFGSGPPAKSPGTVEAMDGRERSQRNWAAFGVQGVAPYWFEIEATAYVGQSGRTAFRFRAEYELLFTQRLVLQPELETNLYAKSDPQRSVSDGLSDASLGLRLRYEIRREIAPYVGVVWKRRFSDAAVGLDSTQTQFVAGLRVWF